MRICRQIVTSNWMGNETNKKHNDDNNLSYRSTHRERERWRPWAAACNVLYVADERYVRFRCAREWFCAGISAGGYVQYQYFFSHKHDFWLATLRCCSHVIVSIYCTVAQHVNEYLLQYTATPIIGLPLALQQQLFVTRKHCICCSMCVMMVRVG